MPVDEMIWFQNHSKFGGNLLIFISRLKALHAIHDTFFLAPDAMHREKIMGKIGRDVLRKMIKEAEALGAIVRVNDSYYKPSTGMRYATEYRFGDIDYTQGGE